MLLVALFYAAVIGNIITTYNDFHQLVASQVLLVSSASILCIYLVGVLIWRPSCTKLCIEYINEEEIKIVIYWDPLKYLTGMISDILLFWAQEIVNYIATSTAQFIKIVIINFVRLKYSKYNSTHNHHYGQNRKIK